MFRKTNYTNLFISPAISFLFVIRFGAGKKKDIEKSKNLTRYLFGIRILILYY